MEPYHNQVTRAQGSFSLRMFHRSWGIVMIQANISAPCAVLDFPTRDDFALQLRTHHYPMRRVDSRLRISRRPWRMCWISGAEVEGKGMAACVLSDLFSARSCWRAPEMVNPCS
jgi:hypothetical protein